MHVSAGLGELVIVCMLLEDGNWWKIERWLWIHSSGTRRTEWTCKCRKKASPMNRAGPKRANRKGIVGAGLQYYTGPPETNGMIKLLVGENDKWFFL